MKRTVSLKRAVISCICVGVVAVILTCAAVYLLMGDLRHTFLKLSEIDFLTDRYFFGEVSAEELDTQICNGYMSALDDKYAQYLPTEKAEEKFDGFKGVKSGIGVTVTVHPDNYSMLVVHVSKDSPADKAGILEKDCIVKVGDTEVTKDTYNDCYNSMLGEIGDEINVTLLRDGTEIPATITIDSFELQSVYSRTVGDYGYVQITQFSDNTVNQFKIAVEELCDKGVKGLIFDVTQNGGGTLDSVAEILDILLPEGTIVSAQFSDGSEEILHTSDSAEIELPMVVLTDNYSASASELFAVSIRDYEKGVLIGDTTYGKGVMQTTYKLDDGSSVKFTVSKFFGKNKTDYTGVGLVPDYPVKLTETEQKYWYLLSDTENPYISKAVQWLDEQQ